jgi:hypothetical protein
MATFAALTSRHTAEPLRDPGTLDVYTAQPLTLTIGRLVVRGLNALRHQGTSFPFSKALQQ